VMEQGRRSSREGLRDATERFARELDALPPGLRGLDPEEYEVTESQRLASLETEVRAAIRARELGD
jgi:hypothetical protein